MSFSFTRYSFVYSVKEALTVMIAVVMPIMIMKMSREFFTNKQTVI